MRGSYVIDFIDLLLRSFESLFAFSFFFLIFLIFLFFQFLLLLLFRWSSTKSKCSERVLRFFGSYIFIFSFLLRWLVYNRLTQIFTFSRPLLYQLRVKQIRFFLGIEPVMGAFFFFSSEAFLKRKRLTIMVDHRHHGKSWRIIIIFRITKFRLADSFYLLY